MEKTLTAPKILCYHCGDECSSHPLLFQDKTFCCEGCMTVYQLLQENDLCTYYDFEKNPGIKIKAKQKEQFAYLDEPTIANQLFDFNEGDVASIRLFIPRIHCSSCIWLLENLYKLREGILYSRVNFVKKEIYITFQKELISLRTIVELLDSFGYTPSITLKNYTREKNNTENKSLYYKIGIAGFCASNIMMLSFPEYLGLEEMKDSSLRVLFGYLNLFLSIPVVFYCANEYFISAFKGLKNKLLNIDVPIALGTSAVFIRSIYEVISQTGPGYFDSLTGLVFFLLIGKWVQKSTYQKFSFERDYQSYFPAAVIKIEHEKESIIPVNDLKEGDEILIRNHEIIPADAILKSGIGHIDYSFVSGEALPVTKHEGMLLYAGGKQIGNSIRLQVTKDFSQSYFLQLWNKEIFTKKSNAYLSSFVLSFSKYFTIGTLVIALGTFLYWYFTDASKALFPVTSVLLVACPCSLALSLPFALSNCLRLMGKKGLYLKSADTVEMLSEIDTIVFDKTGTLTETDLSGIEYVGDGLLAKEIVYVRSAAQHSLHPLSQALYRFLDKNTIETHSFEEIPSCGICCTIDDVKIKLGSADFVGEQEEKIVHEARVYISINGYYKGYYKVKNQYREEMEYFTALLGKYYELHVLSGDNNSEQKKLSAFFKRIKFNQTPQDKLEYIEKLKLEGKKVLMLGDGLNDAGALKAATVGIAVSDNTCNFSPSCDGILEGKKIKNLFSFLAYSKAGIRIIHLSLILSLIYNAIGLYFAVQGLLSPVIAAILMPMSSVTVVLFVVVATSVRAREL